MQITINLPDGIIMRLAQCYELTEENTLKTLGIAASTAIRDKITKEFPVLFSDINVVLDKNEEIK